MTESRSRSRFSDIADQPDQAVDLAEAALLIAREEYPDLEIPRYLDRLEEMASVLGTRVGPGATAEEAATALKEYLFKEQRFRGNARDYYDPRNSFLNEVLERKRGIPITLSLVYMETARRLGLAVEGVGLPGHFIVRVKARDGERLADPYHGGVLVTERDCQKRLDRIYEGRVTLTPGMLAPWGPKQILARILGNLKGIYVRSEDYTRALSMVDLLLRLNPDGAEELRDRGLLYASLDCYNLALRDLTDYLTRAPGAPEAGTLVEKAAEMRRRAARLN